jgi:hypothetical protein
VQLLNVPCLISVSSSTVQTPLADCTETLTTTNLIVGVTGIGIPGFEFFNPSDGSGPLDVAFTSTAFSASDQDDGHAYRISSVNSENYASTRKRFVT